MMRPELSPREVEVLRGMAAGKTNGEIGRGLFLSANTCKSHARRLFTKLGATTRGHAVSQGYQLGILIVARPQPGCVVLRATEQDASRLAAAMFAKLANTEVARAQVLAGLRRLVGAS